MSDLLKQKQAEILQQQITDLVTHDQRAAKLLKMAAVLTFLFFIAFGLELYLGNYLGWSAYFASWHGTLGFIFTMSIVMLTAIFLAATKHHAYLHFGLFGSIALIVVTVIGFALFAEFFSSSANQDAKANINVERSASFRDTRQSNTPITADIYLVSRIAKARQTLARCEENIKAGKEKHCEGDRAQLQALLDSEKNNLSAQIQANSQNEKLRYERQDQLKAEAYNPVVVMMAQLMSLFSGTDYKSHIKAAVVFIMLIVAISFEILHHFLSRAKGQSTAAIQTLEMQLAELQSQDPALSTSTPLTPSMPNYKPTMGFNIPTPITQSLSLPSTAPLVPSTTHAHDEQEQEHKPIGFIWNTSSNRVHTPTHTSNEHQLSIPAISTYAEELRKAGVEFPPDPALNKSAPLADIQAVINRTPTTPATVCTHPSDRVHTPTHTQNKPLAATPSLYKEWLTAIHTGQCKATVRETRPWVQSKIAGKGSQARRSTPTPVDIDALTQSLFQRAVNDPNSKITLNPDYRPGKAKYLLVETNHA
jgi:hypothetical protein